MTETQQEQIERLTMQRNEAREIYIGAANSWSSITHDLMAKHAAEKERLLDALENLTIAIGMGWDLEGVVDVARAALADTHQ